MAGETLTVRPINTEAAGRKAQIINAFTYHPPRPGQQERYQSLRDTARELALLIHTTTPPSREQSLALTKLEECVFWANASIARNE